MTFVRIDRGGIRHFFREQQLYVFVGVALYSVFSALRLRSHLSAILVFALCIGNVITPVMSRLERFYARRAFPFNWLVFLPLLALVALGAASSCCGRRIGTLHYP